MGRTHDVPKIYIRDIESYQKTLRVGQEKRIRVLIKRGAEWRTWARAVITGVYKNVVKVRYPMTVTEQGIQREVVREEYVRIADMLIWERRRGQRDLQGVFGDQD